MRLTSVRARRPLRGSVKMAAAAARRPASAADAGAISDDYFAQAVSDFETEIVYATAITKVSIRSRLITTSFPLIATHSINSTDAVTLKSALADAPHFLWPPARRQTLGRGTSSAWMFLWPPARRQTLI